MPVKAVNGIVFVSLRAESSVVVPDHSFCRTPMSIRSFRMLLRVVELASPILQDMEHSCRRVE